jgi:hypothetical protein
VTDLALQATPLAFLNRPLYGRVVLVLLGVVLLVTTAKFAGLRLPTLQKHFSTDFHAFYVAAQLAWAGTMEQAYYFASMSRLETALTGVENFVPWSYPPPYNLLMAPLAILSVAPAYGLFTGATLIAYLTILRRLSGPHFTFVAVSIFPSLMINTSSGQNGFLTGALIGLSCLGLLQSRPLAGLPLGLMIIKPHLAVGIGVFTLLTSRWKAASLAVLVGSLTLAVSTLVFGVKIWTAFPNGLHETRVFLELGFYQLNRMTSIYAAVRGFGAPANVAFVAQAAVAATSLAIVWAAVRRKMIVTQQLALAVIASLLISPSATTMICRSTGSALRC